MISRGVNIKKTRDVSVISRGVNINKPRGVSVNELTMKEDFKFRIS